MNDREILREVQTTGVKKERFELDAYFINKKIEIF